MVYWILNGVLPVLELGCTRLSLGLPSFDRESTSVVTLEPRFNRVVLGFAVLLFSFFLQPIGRRHAAARVFDSFVIERATLLPLVFFFHFQHVLIMVSL